MASKRQILQRSMVVGFFSLLGGLTGVLVETSIAAKLGLSRSSDAFYAAFTVPYIITNLIGATGQFSLVPFFSSLDARASRDDLWHGLSYALNVIFLGASLIAGVGALTAPWVIQFIAPGFSQPEMMRAAGLCHWLFLIIIPAGLAEAFRSFLLSQHRFAFSSGAGLIRNVCVIACILLTFHRYGPYSIALGYFTGYLLQLAVLGGQTLVSYSVRYSLTLTGSGEAFSRLQGAGAAQLLGALSWQGVVIAERIIASFLPPGTLTALNYGVKIMSTLADLLSGSVGTASLPALSRAVAQHDGAAQKRIFQHALEIGLVLISPVTVFCLLLSHPIIRLVFERGNFTPQATLLMSKVFFYYSLSLVPFASMRVLTFYLFARHEGGLFLRLSVLQYGLTIIFDVLYVFGLRIGAKGIPLGLLSGLLVTCAVALELNVAALKDVFDRSLGIFTAKSFLGAILAAFGMWALYSRLALPRTTVANFVYLCELCGEGTVIFAGTLAVSGAVRFSQLATMWHRTEDA